MAAQLAPLRPIVSDNPNAHPPRRLDIARPSLNPAAETANLDVGSQHWNPFAETGSPRFQSSPARPNDDSNNVNSSSNSLQTALVRWESSAAPIDIPSPNPNTIPTNNHDTEKPSLHGPIASLPSTSCLRQRMHDLKYYGVENLPTCLLQQACNEGSTELRRLKQEARAVPKSYNSKIIDNHRSLLGEFSLEISTRKINSKGPPRDPSSQLPENGDGCHEGHDSIDEPIAVEDFHARPIAKSNSKADTTPRFDRYKTCGWCDIGSFRCQHSRRLIECMTERYNTIEFLPLLEIAYEILLDWEQLKVQIFPGDVARQDISSSDLFIEQRTEGLRKLDDIITQWKTTICQLTKGMPVANVKVDSSESRDSLGQAGKVARQERYPLLTNEPVVVEDVKHRSLHFNRGQRSWDLNLDEAKFNLNQGTMKNDSPRSANSKRHTELYEDTSPQRNVKRRRLCRRKSWKSLDSAVYLDDDYAKSDDTESRDTSDDSSYRRTFSKLEKRISTATNKQSLAVLHQFCAENKLLTEVALMAVCKAMPSIISNVSSSLKMPPPVADLEKFADSLGLPATDPKTRHNLTDEEPAQLTKSLDTSTEDEVPDSQSTNIPQPDLEDPSKCQNCGVSAVKQHHCTDTECSYHPGMIYLFFNNPSKC